jgi:hypothetical protein
MNRRSLWLRGAFGTLGAINLGAILISGHVAQINLVGIVICGIGAAVLMARR